MHVKVHTLSPSLVGFFCSMVLCQAGWLMQLRADAPDYARIGTVLKTYCSGCHNDGDADGDFVVGSYQDLLAAKTDSGTLVVPGDPESSLLYSLLAGTAEPVMPPRDQPQPSAEHVEWIRAWIAAGALDNSGDSPPSPAMSRVAPAAPSEHLTSAAALLADGRIALGRSGHIAMVDLADHSIVNRIELPGFRITSLQLSPCQGYLAIGASQVGVLGEVILMDLTKGEFIFRQTGHQDAIYALAFSADGGMIASAGYDRAIRLWDVPSGQMVKQLIGHQAAVYDLDFHPSGKMLASASADQSVKLWHVSRGSLLNTLGQPEGEMRCLKFSADGLFLLAAGADRQIRCWRILSTEDTEITPMIEARFAHESEINSLLFGAEQVVFSAALDGSIKAWRLPGLSPLGVVASSPQVPVAVLLGENDSITLVGLKGALHTFDVCEAVRQSVSAEGERLNASAPQNANPVKDVPSESMESLSSSSNEDIPFLLTVNEYIEQEPNDTPEQAMQVQMPLRIVGCLSTGINEGAKPDNDLFRFSASKGDTWIFEVEAARINSPVDSKIEILDMSGNPVLQKRMQAVRESYFTFRGKDSVTSDDFRLHKWEDMELDEFLYANSEVTRLWMYPRGPDSGFKVYPGMGSRHTFFNTTAVSHALGSPAYIVRPLAGGEEPLPNGLPVFPLYFENDDDPMQRLGPDSFLTFRAPTDGEYIIRLRDSRGFGGANFNYRLVARKPSPDFVMNLTGLEMNIPAGSGREWSVTIVRNDGFNNPIEIRLDNIPKGIIASNPVIVQAGQTTAFGTVYVTNAAELSEQEFAIQLTATVLEDETPEDLGGIRLEDFTGTQVGHAKVLEEKLSVKVSQTVEPQVTLLSLDGSRQELTELVVKKGKTVSALLSVQRNGLEGPISLGQDDAGRNLPHGCFVDNIGLNGLLITENNSDREIFITGSPKLSPGRWQFHFKAKVGEQPTSKPIWLIIEH
jgi:hypothetical protein